MLIGRWTGGGPAAWIGRLLRALIRAATRPDLRDALLGDLEEERALRARRGSRREADRWYRRQLARSLVPALLGRLAGARSARPDVPLPRRTPEETMTDLLDAGRRIVRTLARTPAFTATVVLTLALGIGASTAVVTVMRGVLMQPLPYPDPDRLGVLSGADGADALWLSIPNYRDLATSLRSFEALGVYSPEDAIVGDASDPRRLGVAEVDAGYFRALGVEPVLGRTFTAEEVDAAAPVAVLSHGFWVRTGADPDVLGTSVVLDDRPREVIGVLGPTRPVPAEAEVWVPIRTDAPAWRTRRGIAWVHVLARRAAHATPEVAADELAAAARSLQEAHPDANRDLGLGFRGIEEATLGGVRRPLEVLGAAVLVLLLAACANVAGMLAARSADRGAEVSVRVALGSGRGRLARRFLAEGLVLAGAGGLLGVVLARLGVTGLLALAPPDTPRLDAVSLDGGVLALAAAVTLGCALVFGLAPAIQLRGFDGVASLGRRGGTGRRSPGRRALIVGQIAAAMALAVGAGLLGRSFQALTEVELGLEPDGVVAAGLPVVESRFGSLQERRLHHLAILEAVERLPEVEAAGLTNVLPFVNLGPTFSYELRDPPADPDDRLLARYRVVTPGYFEAQGIALVAGRTFSPEEVREGGPRAVVVSASLARDHFPPGQAVGREIHVLDEWHRIVGVTEDVLDRRISGEPARMIHVPVTRAPRQGMALVARTSGDPGALVGSVRAAVRSVAPDQALTPMAVQSAWIGESVAQPRFAAVVFAFFAGATVLLAAVGVFGLLAYSVLRRTREIGIRMAVGAGAARVRGRVVADAAVLAGAGVAAGLAIALWGARRLEPLLFGVEPTEPAVLAAGAALVFGAALAAAWVPATRAAHVEPTEALRAE